MDKDNFNIKSLSHGLNLNERKTLMLTGVKKIESFDDAEFLLETTLGYLLIKGEGLELLKMDSISGNVSIKGYVNSLMYIDDAKKKNSENSIFNRLFK